MKRIRILLVDDHAVVRQGFKMILGAQADMEIVGEAGNGREAVQLAEELRPDIVVMDVAMPELNGIEATRRLLASLPHTRVIALSMHKDSVYVRETLRAGARGYLLKDSPAGRPGHRRAVGCVGRELSQPGRIECRARRLPPARHQSHRPPHHAASAKSSRCSPRARPTRRSRSC